MNNFLKNIKTWLSIWIWFILIVFLSWIVYSAWTNIPELKKSSWEQLTSTTWNNLVDNIDYLNWWLKIPVWLVSAFNLEKCPAGWKPLDWTAWTPDLRWKFIRWLNSFDGWQTKITGDNSDIDWEIRTLWSFQDDAIRNIEGGYVWPTTKINNNFGIFKIEWWKNASWPTSSPGQQQLNTNISINLANSIWEEHVWADIRPKNIALIYCEKE